MERKMMTSNGTLIRIREHEGKEYVRVVEISQGLGYAQYNHGSSMIRHLSDAAGVEAQLLGRNYVLEKAEAIKLLEVVAQNMKQRGNDDRVKKAVELLKKLKGNESRQEELAFPSAAAEPADDMSEVISWAAALSERYGLSPSEALRMAERALK